MSIMHYPSMQELADTDTMNASWWASVARSLDEFDEQLTSDRAADCGPGGALIDAVTRQPSLANDAAKLSDDHDRLIERARRLRRLVATVAGDDRMVVPVAAELASLAEAHERYRRRVRSLLWDSFVRDLGGE